MRSFVTFHPCKVRKWNTFDGGNSFIKNHQQKCCKHTTQYSPPISQWDSTCPVFGTVTSGDRLISVWIGEVEKCWCGRMLALEMAFGIIVWFCLERRPRNQPAREHEGWSLNVQDEKSHLPNLWAMKPSGFWGNHHIIVGCGLRHGGHELSRRLFI